MERFLDEYDLGLGVNTNTNPNPNGKKGPSEPEDEERRSLFGKDVTQQLETYRDVAWVTHPEN